MTIERIYERYDFLKKLRRIEIRKWRAELDIRILLYPDYRLGVLNLRQNKHYWGLNTQKLKNDYLFKILYKPGNYIYQGSLHRFSDQFSWIKQGCVNLIS